MDIATTTPTHARQTLVIALSDGARAPASRLQDLPTPPGLPVLGNLLQLAAGDVHRQLEDWSARHGPMFRISVGKSHALVVNDPAVENALLRHRPNEMARNPSVGSLMSELGPTGLFSAEGERWRRQRRLVMRALTPEAIANFHPTLLTVTRRLQARWTEAARAGTPVDVVRDLKRYSIDVTTWLAMGVDVDTLTHADNPLQTDVEYIFATLGRRLRMPVRYWHWLKLPADRRADAAMARIAEVSTRLIEQARTRLAADPALRARPSNILEALLLARDEPGSEFTDDDVRGNVATMLFAGEDTTANAIAWLLYFLASKPPVQQRARDEADALLGERSVADRPRELDALDYLEAAAIESMRLKPVAPLMSLKALCDLDLGGLHVPRGTLVFMVHRATALDPRHFSDPFAFDPGRWLGDAAEQADDPKRKLFPFGGGPRYCPGRYLAMVEIKLVASMALHAFDLSVAVDPDHIREHFTFTLGPETLPLRFAAR